MAVNESGGIRIKSMFFDYAVPYEAVDSVVDDAVEDLRGRVLDPKVVDEYGVSIDIDKRSGLIRVTPNFRTALEDIHHYEIYCSPLARCTTTAYALREKEYGGWEIAAALLTLGLVSCASEGAKQVVDDTWSRGFEDVWIDTVQGDATDDDGAAGTGDASSSSLGCTDSDGHDYENAGSISFLDEDDVLQTLHDTCKVSGKDGLLAEATCDNYEVGGTKPSQLVEFIKCNCHEGECIDDSVVLCTDPAAEVRFPGGSVWTNDEGKTHISTCTDNMLTSVTWYYCNDDGTLHEDITPCDPGILCGDGMCGGFTCTDDELPGQDPQNENKGDVHLFSPSTGEEKHIYDACTGTAAVKTYECPLHTSTDFDSLKKTIKVDYDSYEDCPDDKQCEGGICIDEYEACISDSDPENDIHIKGILYVWDDSIGELREVIADFCNTSLQKDGEGSLFLSGGNQVYQKNCNDEGLITSPEASECLEGETCIDGMCMEVTASGGACAPICTEDDGGINVFVGDRLSMIASCDSSYIAGVIEYCVDAKNVMEYYCDGDSPKYAIEECPEDYFCVNNYHPDYAHCVECEDLSDSQNDPGVLGEVLDIQGVYNNDFCTNDGQLKQVFCSPENGLSVWTSPENCPEGTACEQGICN